MMQQIRHGAHVFRVAMVQSTFGLLLFRSDPQAGVSSITVRQLSPALQLSTVYKL
jgi:hypothetical protein